MEESRNHNGEQKKSNTREHILRDQMYMKLWSLNLLMVLSGHIPSGRGRGQDWRDVGTLLALVVFLTWQWS